VLSATAWVPLPPAECQRRGSARDGWESHVRDLQRDRPQYRYALWGGRRLGHRGDVHAIEVDEIAQSQDPFTPDLYHARWTDRHGSGFAITAAIGVLTGVGFYLAAAVATLLVLGTLSAFRWLEQALPSQIYAHHHVKFERGHTMPELEVRKLITSHAFSIANMSYRVSGDGRFFEYRMIIRTNDWDNMRRLAETLRDRASIVEFRISPTGD
jgi:hypothetical protein